MAYPPSDELFPDQRSTLNRDHQLGSSPTSHKGARCFDLANGWLVKIHRLKVVSYAVMSFSLCGCGPSVEERADVGFDDGYAAGYNTTCKIRATLIQGDWDNEHYSEAYQRGYAYGVEKCLDESD